jgi:hypothetical protein
MSLIILTPAQSLYNERLAIVLGLITLVAGIGVFASCRTCISLLTRFGIAKPLESPFFRRLYSWHPYFWWAFWMGLILHISTALFHTGFPVNGDPDASIHWWILGLGLGSLLLVPGTLLSCRVIASAVEFFTQKNPISWGLYRGFYRLHSYYWLPLALVVFAHFIVAGNHVNFWPSQPPG